MTPVFMTTVFMKVGRFVLTLVQEDQFVVRMNHTKLIKSALLGAGVPTDKLHPLLEKLVACKVSVC